MEIVICNSLEEIANQIVNFNREFFDEVQKRDYYSKFEENIVKSLTKEHDPKYEYSHMIISRESFYDDNLNISGENGNIDTTTEWEHQEQLLEIVHQKKKTVTINRLVNKQKQELEKEQKQKQEECEESQKERALNEEHDKKEYARLKSKFEGS